MPPQEILRLEERVAIGIEAGESHFREFKSALERDESGATRERDFKSICRDIGEALVSFANADGGELLVGVEDDTSVTGIPHKEDLIQAMKSAFREYVHSDTPLPSPAVGQVLIDDKCVLYFSVGKSVGAIHLTSDGRCLQRSDRENRPVAAEQIQTDRQELISREYDRAFVDGATTANLDLALVNRMVETIAPGYSAEKFLQYLGLAEYGHSGLRLRRAALLLFANEIGRWHPRCSVRIVRVSGTELGVGEKYNIERAEDDQLVSGTILQLFDDAWNTLRPHLARTRFETSGLFRESLIYPEVACREALVNAIAHRDYSREGSPIEVFVFDDRMEFRSPGGLLSSISVERLSSLEGVHESRNVLIARALREVGRMREIGEGIPRIFLSMRESELVDPLLEAGRDRFTVTLQHRSIFTRQDVEWLQSYEEFDLSKNEQRVVLLGRDGHLLSTNEIILVTGIVDIDDFRALNELLRMKGILYNAKPRLGGGSGRRREIGRFRVRPPKEVEQYFGELLSGLRAIAPAAILSPSAVRRVRSSLSSKSPYTDRPDSCLQALGFIDAQKRLLPKAFAYVPDLEQIARPTIVSGEIRVVRPARFGFIRANDGTEFFFHESNLNSGLGWNALAPGFRVEFEVKSARTSEEKDVAIDIRAAKK